MSGGRRYNLSRDELLVEVEKVIRETEVVADIGCGIVPMAYFRPKLHFMIEPWKEYSDILSYRHRNDKSVTVLRLGALEALKAFGNKSIDSIFMLDVIEHLPKDMGIDVIAECERVAREQIVLFTPLGFMPQHMQQGESDAWGLSGAIVQEHLSGWTPEDFGHAWCSYVSEDYHQVDFKREKLDRTYGAFFAIRNLEPEPIEKPKTYTDLRRPLPAEIKLQQLRTQFSEISTQFSEISAAYNSLSSHPVVKFSREIKRLLKVGRR
jgi:hypothetical protein